MHYYPLGVLAISWVFYLWETYLDLRQYKVYKKTQKVPSVLEDEIDHETFVKAKSYSIDKATFGFISNLFSQIQSTITIYYFLMPYFWDLSYKILNNLLDIDTNRFDSNSIHIEILQSLIFTLGTSILSTLINLPFSIYNTFVLEERHGFNKQTAGFYAWDKLKSFVLSFVIAAPVVAATIYIVRNGGPYFFMYLWIFCFVVVLVIIFFHGEIFALFDKFTPLPPGDLRDKIEELSSGLNFPLKNIFVVEGSKRSSHSNAYQSGIFNKKRIVIYDTLIEGYYDGKEDKKDEKENKDTDKKKGCTTDEILAILCHELGHWYHSHLWTSLAFAELNYFLMFMMFSKFYMNQAFYSAFGFSQMPVIIGLALMMQVLTPYNELLGFISTYMSRSKEYQADQFAKKKGRAEQLKTGLVKLNKDNLGFPVHDELYSMFNHSHPTLIQRLKALDKVE